MITAVFFDLDGTLLPMDQEVFVKAYLAGMARKLAPHGYDPEKLTKAVWKGTGAMTINDGTQKNCLFCGRKIFYTFPYGIQKQTILRIFRNSGSRRRYIFVGNCSSLFFFAYPP